jgi:hypothetical protein
MFKKQAMARGLIIDKTYSALQGASSLCRIFSFVGFRIERSPDSINNQPLAAGATLFLSSIVINDHQGPSILVGLLTEKEGQITTVSVIVSIRARIHTSGR